MGTRGKRGWIAAWLLILGGCVAAPEAPSERGLGQADGVVGSCEAACGEASPDGNCWCDAECAEHGDCCADKVEACGGAPSTADEPVLCRDVEDCPAGLTCEQSACYSGCREGEDCEDACLGLCTEPQQQSVPLPSPPSGDSPADDPTDPGEPAGDDGAGVDEPMCNCPEGALCVPLCPVCPPEVPDEECQCVTVCVTH